MRVRLFAIVALVLVASAEVARADSSGASLTLAEALALARTRSPDLRGARAERSAASAEADAALSGYTPGVSGEVGVTQTSARSTNYDQPVNYDAAYTTRRRDAAATLRWTIFDFWQTPSRVGAANANERAAGHRVLASELAVVRAVASAYFTIVFDDEIVEATRTSSRIRERQLAFMRGQVTSGLRATSDEARARVELDLAKVDVIDAERQAAQDRVELARLLFLPPGAPLKLARPTLPRATEDARAAAKTAGERRPEVHASDEDVESRREAATAASVARLPTVGLSVQAYDRSVIADRNPLFPSERGIVAGATASIPIFDWSIWGRVPVARAEADAASAQRDATVARVRAEGAQAAIASQASRQIYEQLKSTAELAGATLAVVEGRYQAGLATATNLFDATDRESEARRGAIRAELDLALANVAALAATNNLKALER